jgi:hypothetical protein
VIAMHAGFVFGTCLISGVLASVILMQTVSITTLFAAAVLCAYGIAIMFL